MEEGGRKVLDPQQPAQPARAYGVAIGSTAVTVLLRLALDPFVGNSFPFIFTFAAIALSAAYGGWGPAILATLLGYVASDLLFIPPRGGLAVFTTLDGLIGCISYLFTCGIVAWLATAMRKSRGAAEAAAAELSVKNAELDSQRRRVQVTLSSIGDAVISTDAQSRVEFINPAAEHLTGWKAAEAHGRPLTEVFRIVNETTRQPVENPVEKVLKTGKVVGLANHTVVIARDGTETPIADSAAPIRDSAQAILGVVLVFRDVSDAREVESALRTEVDRSQLLSETLQDLMSAADPNSIVRELCPRVAAHVEADCFFNFMVAPDGDSLRLHSCAGIPDETAKSIELLQFGQAICGVVAQTKQPLVVSDIQHNDDPRATLVREFGIQAYACSPLMAGDRLLGTLSFASRKRTHYTPSELEFLRTVSNYVALALHRLMTEQTLREQAQAIRDSEERFRLVAENIPQLAWMAEANGDIVWYNQRWYDFTGTRFEEMQGWGWRSVHDPDHVHRVEWGYKAALTGGKEWEDTFPLRRHDGVYRWFLSRAFPIRNSEGQILNWFGTNTDITELREAQEALQHSQVELEREKAQLEQVVQQRTARLTEMVADLESFSYSIAHDLRAPLRAMRGFAGIVESELREKANEDQRDLLRRIAVSAERMDAMIRDVLEYTKVMKNDIDLAPVDPATLTREIIESYPHLQPPAAKIEIQTPMPAVQANRPALTQVLSNLLSNGKKFVAPGVHPTMTVRGENHDGKVRIWVEDNGIGIPPEARERIFGMFQRGHAGSRYDGTGIGLAIVRKAAERMGGRVGLESEPGKGSRFWVELSAAEAHHGNGSTATPASKRGAGIPLM